MDSQGNKIKMKKCIEYLGHHIIANIMSPIRIELETWYLLYVAPEVLRGDNDHKCDL